MPAGGARIDDAASTRTFLGFVPRAGADAPRIVASTAVFDPLAYGSGTYPSWAQRPFDASDTMVLDRLPRLTEDGPAYAFTVGGAVYPQIPPTVVREGDTVELTIVNRGFDTHPMHPHGHRVLVLAVDGKRPPAPLWLDSFDVLPGQVWKVALVADNPGIWMDHCHNLEHAALGMVTHLAYVGVVSPFEHGGAARNDAE
jgi:FtsP/CotA-like multicopper oxidase with cupredoxin domain